MKSLRPLRLFVPLAGVSALAFPLVGAAAASTLRRAAPASTRTFTGATVAAHQWGTVTVNVTVRSGNAARKFSDLGGGYTYHTARSQFIMSQALPLLRHEFLAAQSTNIHLISGATYTSEAFVGSLQSALLKAHA